MTRRRMVAIATTVAASSALAAGAIFGTSAQAETPRPVRVSDDWACIALEGVDIGTCIENPLPDLSDTPTVAEILQNLLGQGR